MTNNKNFEPDTVLPVNQESLIPEVASLGNIEYCKRNITANTPISYTSNNRSQPRIPRIYQ
ncbi:hypothetical protein H6792_02775 [Candidatus Nomurabacteria bacterium]|nr:hypothetical protein [Candidatus Nomurabacteria bacterium]